MDKLTKSGASIYKEQRRVTGKTVMSGGLMTGESELGGKQQQKETKASCTLPASVI